MSSEGLMNWLKSFWERLNTPMPAAGHGLHARPDLPLGSGWAESETVSCFTPRAQQVLTLARKEADRFNHNFVGTEHLLLGLIKLGQGTAVNVLGQMGLDLETVRQEVEKQVGPGPDQKIIGNIPYTPRVKKVLALAAKEAKALNHTYVGTEHILLGLLREGDGVAARVLQSLHVDTEVTRQHIFRELDPNYALKSDDVILPRKLEIQSDRGPLDVSKRYDVYCGEGDQQVVYRNALFKGVKTLFQEQEWNVYAEYLELEQADGRTIFISRMSVIKFCEHDSKS